MKKIFLALLLFLIMSTCAYSQLIRILVTDQATLSAPGSSTAISCENYTDVTWYFTIANINTNVTVALQSKAGDSEWTTVWTSLTYTADGNYGVEWGRVATADSLKFTFVSETGGTTATIAHNAKLVGGI
jgi:hypothetical protein